MAEKDTKLIGKSQKGRFTEDSFALGFPVCVKDSDTKKEKPYLLEYCKIKNDGVFPDILTNRRIIPKYMVTPEVNTLTLNYNALSDLFVELYIRFPELIDLKDLSYKSILKNRIIGNMERLYSLIEDINDHGLKVNVNKFNESEYRIDSTLADMAELEKIVLQRNNIKKVYSKVDKDKDHILKILEVSVYESNLCNLK